MFNNGANASIVNNIIPKINISTYNVFDDVYILLEVSEYDVFKVRKWDLNASLIDNILDAIEYHKLYSLMYAIITRSNSVYINNVLFENIYNNVTPLMYVMPPCENKRILGEDITIRVLNRS